MVAVVALVVALSIGAVQSAGQPQTQGPLEAYKVYRDVLAKATSLQMILPFYTKELSAGLQRMPKEMQANYLKMNALALTDMKVTKQTIDANKAVFEITAKTNDGGPTYGKATLVKEGNAWKIEDDAWATSLPAK